MQKYLFSFLVFLGAMCSPLLAFADYTITTATTDNQISNFKGATGSFDREAQEFTTTAAGTISTASYSLDKNNSPTDSVVVSIYTDSSGAVGTLIATSNSVLGSTLQDSLAGPAMQAFTFASPVSVAASTHYWLVVSRTGARSTSHYYETGGDGSGNTSGFNWAYGSSGGFNYSGLSGQWAHTSEYVVVAASSGLTFSQLIATSTNLFATITGFDFGSLVTFVGGIMLLLLGAGLGLVGAMLPWVIALIVCSCVIYLIYKAIRFLHILR